MNTVTALLLAHSHPFSAPPPPPSTVLLSHRCGRHREALQWLDAMARSGCTPDEVSYSAVINALGKAGRAADALRVFERMMDAGWVPDPVTCATGR